MSRTSAERSSVLNLIITPISFFILGAGIVTAVFLPIASPFLSSVPLIITKEPPVFEKRVNDIFINKKVEELPATNELIEVPPQEIPAQGERYGQLTIQSAGIDAQLFYGDSNQELSQGVGTYAGAYIPGAGRTILLAGHNNTDFHTLGEVQIGDIVSINTSYGQYKYKIIDTRLTTDTDETAYDFSRTDENLIMYTCYPFDTLGLTPQRYFVYAEYISGPRLELVY
ncbi:MAG: class D sortase [Clostridiales bacterium]|nr:class D sortase [Clostridiales bacterium]